MKRLSIFMVSLLCSVNSMAASRCYDTNTLEDKVILWIANRDSVTAQTAFNDMVESAISQIRDESSRSSEITLKNALRICLDNNDTFTITIDIDTELPVGVCQ